MAWRLVTVADLTWAVAVAVERRANSTQWKLVLAFRPQQRNAGRTIWAEYPLQSSSRSSLYDQAERLSDAVLAEFLESRLRGVPA